jgi:hypothetical protein
MEETWHVFLFYHRVSKWKKHGMCFYSITVYENGRNMACFYSITVYQNGRNMECVSIPSPCIKMEETWHVFLFHYRVSKWKKHGMCFYSITLYQNGRNMACVSIPPQSEKIICPTVSTYAINIE